MTIEALQTLIEQCGVHPAVGLEAGGWGIEQNAWELARFLYAMQELGVSSVLEIGTGAQAGLSRFMHEHMHWHVTTVDKNGHYGDYPGIEFVVSEERRDFGDRTFDLVIIDGDHAYESVKADHEWYGKYATKAVMFHDIAGLRDCEGALQYWSETVSNMGQVIRRVGFHEIIAADENTRCGIGWYEVNDTVVYTDTWESKPDHIAIYGGVEQSLRELGVEIKEGYVEWQPTPLDVVEPPPQDKPAFLAPVEWDSEKVKEAYEKGLEASKDDEYIFTPKTEDKPKRKRKPKQ